MSSGMDMSAEFTDISYNMVSAQNSMPKTQSSTESANNDRVARAGPHFTPKDEKD